MFIGIAILIKFASSTNVPSISVLQFLNGAQFLNATYVAALSGCFLLRRLLPSAAVVLVTATAQITKIYASE